MGVEVTAALYERAEGPGPARKLGFRPLWFLACPREGERVEMEHEGRLRSFHVASVSHMPREGDAPPLLGVALALLPED